MKPKISIIIPVYNAEKYLRECLDSVLAQTFTDFEVLLINDGSTDNSGQICDAYALQDTRIKVFHQENGGVSSARNLGLDNAKGEWITFVDSDDYLGDNYFSILEKSSLSEDFILMKIFRVYRDTLKKIVEFPNSRYTTEEFIREWTLYPHFPGPYSKFFRLFIIKKNKLYFNPNLSFGEDALFNINYLSHCKLIRTDNTIGYYYRDSPEGLSYKRGVYNEAITSFEEIKRCISSILKRYPDLGQASVLEKNLKSPTLRVIESIYTDPSYPNPYLKLKEFVKHNNRIIMYAYKQSIGIAYAVRLLLFFKNTYLLHLLYKQWIYRK